MKSTPQSRLCRAARRLAREVAPLRFAAPVSHVYNPLDYAWRAHAAYLERFARASCRVVFLGMNPGPFGMAQTGVPFGDVTRVRDFLGIEVDAILVIALGEEVKTAGFVGGLAVPGGFAVEAHEHPHLVLEGAIALLLGLPLDGLPARARNPERPLEVAEIGALRLGLVVIVVPRGK